MTWIPLESLSQIDDVISQSRDNKVLIFKHSTRCSISSIAKMRLESDIVSDSFLYYYLDLIKFRDISDKIAEKFVVHHESPQVLIIDNGDCIYDESHLDITAKEIEKILGE